MWHYLMSAKFWASDVPSGDFRSFDDVSWLQMLVQSTENKLIINLTVKQ